MGTNGKQFTTAGGGVATLILGGGPTTAKQENSRESLAVETPAGTSKL